MQESQDGILNTFKKLFRTLTFFSFFFFFFLGGGGGAVGGWVESKPSLQEKYHFCFTSNQSVRSVLSEYFYLYSIHILYFLFVFTTQLQANHYFITPVPLLNNMVWTADMIDI